jgi:hypothetical protein
MFGLNIGGFFSQAVASAAALAKTAFGPIMTAAQSAAGQLSSGFSALQGAVGSSALGMSLQYAISLPPILSAGLNILQNPMGFVKGLAGAIVGKAVTDITNTALNPVLNKAGFNANIGINPAGMGLSLGLNLQGPAGLGLSINGGGANLSLVNSAVQAQIGTYGNTLQTAIGTQALTAAGTLLNFPANAMSIDGTMIGSSTSITLGGLAAAQSHGPNGGHFSQNHGGVSVAVGGDNSSANAGGNPTIALANCPIGLIAEGACVLPGTGFENYLNSEGVISVFGNAEGGRGGEGADPDGQADNGDSCGDPDGHSRDMYTCGRSSLWTIYNRRIT